MSGASPPLAAAAADDEENEQQQKTKTNQLVAGSYSMALIRALEFAGVKFLRYHALDVANSARCKVKPLKMLKMSSSSSSSILNLDLDNQVCIAKVCFGGLPNFCDVPSPDCGLTAKGSLVLVPDLSTLRILPYAPDSAMVLCNLREQDSGKKASDLCTRSLLQRIASRAAKEHQIAFNVGVEIEFCLYDRKTNQPVDVSKFSNTTTLNQQQGFLADLYHQLERQEIDVELIHAESAHGQLEIVLQYCRGDPVEMADKVVLCRETIVNVARLHGLKALFLPKIDPNGAGNGSHVHLSFIDVETGRNLFPNNTVNDDDDEESPSSNSNRGAGRSFFLESLPKHGISEKGRSFMEGILQHLPALLALTIPTANSFRRVGPGCWTGHSVGWDFEEKEAPLRVVADLTTQSWEHFEVKLVDSIANIYLALAGILAAGLDGLEKNLTLRPSLGDEAAAAMTTTAAATPAPSLLLPRTIDESLNLLQQNDFLMNSVLPKALSRGYLAVRRDEAKRAANMTLEEEVQEALDRA